MEFEITKWPDIKTKVLSSILMDDLAKARDLLHKNNTELDLVRELLNQVDNETRPLENHATRPPKDIFTPVSYTCGIGCEMCISGYGDRTSIFEDYKYLSPEQFDEILPWIETADHVVYVGTGETLDNPHIYDFVKKSTGKPSTLMTSGLALTKNKVKRLIGSNLETLCFSFDGITSAGHGSGSKKYWDSIWDRIDMIQSLKRELDSDTPHIMLNMVVDIENVDQIDEMVDLLLCKNASMLHLSAMIPHNESLFNKSIFTDFKHYQKIINRSIKRGNEKGLQVQIDDTDELKDFQPCPYADNRLVFNIDRYQPSVCCGPIEMPLKITGPCNDTYWNSFPFRYFRFMHATGNAETLPTACDTCWIMNPLKFSEKIQPQDNDFDAQPLYLQAGELKRNNQWAEAEKIYKTITEKSPDPTWKGKAFFHLAEQKIREKNYPKAYALLQETVKNYYEHQLAFVYFYLLMIVLEQNQEEKSLETLQCNV